MHTKEFLIGSHLCIESIGSMLQVLITGSCYRWCQLSGTKSLFDRVTKIRDTERKLVNSRLQLTYTRSYFRLIGSLRVNRQEYIDFRTFSDHTFTQCRSN